MLYARRENIPVTSAAHFPTDDKLGALKQVAIVRNSLLFSSLAPFHLPIPAPRVAPLPSAFPLICHTFEGILEAGNFVCGAISSSRIQIMTRRLFLPRVHCGTFGSESFAVDKLFILATKIAFFCAGEATRRGNRGEI
jgi:hypothetical protein